MLRMRLVLHAQGFVQGHITRRKRIGPAQGPQRNVVRRPGANAGQGLQCGHGGGDIGTGVQAERALQHRLRKGLDGFLTLLHDAELTQHIGVCGGQGRCAGEQAIDSGKEAGWQCVLRR